MEVDLEKVWSPSTWSSKPIRQNPGFKHDADLLKVKTKLSQRLPLVFGGEIDRLREELIDVQVGKRFLLQAGDCAESFDQDSVSIASSLRAIFHVAVVLSYGANLPVTKIVRMAGQFAKPRSNATEIRDGFELPVYRGDAVNGFEFTSRARRSDPLRLLAAYDHSASRLNLIRAVNQGVVLDFNCVTELAFDSLLSKAVCRKYFGLSKDIQKVLTPSSTLANHRLNTKLRDDGGLYTCHEALLLDYEEAMTRCDSISGKIIDTSAHMLWLGNRTRQIENAHVEFLRGVHNPIGIKVGPGIQSRELIRLIQVLNPDDEPGRITVIARFGADQIVAELPQLLRGVKKSGFKVGWVCDPMHGNTITSGNGKKTRSMDKIFDELRLFMTVLEANEVIPGGVHLEMTGEDVLECVGGLDAVGDAQLLDRYTSKCDPRLNGAQALELALEFAQWISKR